MTADASLQRLVDLIARTVAERMEKGDVFRVPKLSLRPRRQGDCEAARWFFLQAPLGGQLVIDFVEQLNRHNRLTPSLFFGVSAGQSPANEADGQEVAN